MTFAFTNLDEQRRIGGKLIVSLCWVMAVVVISARLGVHGSLLGLGAATLLVAGGATFARTIAGEGSSGRALTGVALMAQVSLLVAALSGHAWQIDMHMTYFAALAALVVYCDWIVIVAATATVAVHHLGLNFLLPALVFPGQGDLGRVVVHAVILVGEAAALIGVTASLNRMFALIDADRSKAEAAVNAAQAAQDLAEAARRSEEDGRAAFAQDQARAEQIRAQTVSMLGQALSRLADGDLTTRIDAEFGTEFSQIKLDFNAAAASLRKAMEAISAATGGIRAGSDEIAGASDDLSRRTETQAASLEQTAAALDEITATVKQGADGARRASVVVSSAKTDAQRAGEVVRDAVTAMGQIEQSSGQITQIIGVIDEIAFQTNLLALNAGVEAARAGDSGRGFAVVAQEVRALAQRSAEAAKQIKGLIATSSDQVRRGVDLVGDTGAALEGIVAKVAEMDGIIAAIAQSSQEQAGGLSQVNVAVNQMDQFTQQNAAMVEQATAAASALRGEAEELARRLALFRTGDASAKGAVRTPAVIQEARAPARAVVGGRGKF